MSLPLRAHLTIRPLEDRTCPAGGLMDPSFGGGDGIVRFDLPGFSGVAALGVATLPDGKTVLAGYGDSTRKEAVVYRLNVDGTLDTSFGGGDGFSSIAITGQDAYFYDVEVQPDGKIV